jgi:hypothetical protein
MQDATGAFGGMTQCPLGWPRTFLQARLLRWILLSVESQLFAGRHVRLGRSGQQLGLGIQVRFGAAGVCVVRRAQHAWWPGGWQLAGVALSAGIRGPRLRLEQIGPTVVLVGL